MNAEQIHQIQTLLQSSNIDTVEQGTRLAESTVGDMVQFQKLIETVSGKPLVGLRRDIIREAFEGFHHQSFLGLWAFCLLGKWDEDTQGTIQLRLNRQYLSRIPSSIEYLHNLEEIKAESQPSNIYTRIHFKLSQLKTVEMNANQITEIPESIGELSDLCTVDMSYNSISELPESIGKLQKLTKLSFIECPINSIPQTFKHLTNLQHLDLSLSGYTDTRTPEQRTAIRDTFNHSLVIELTWDPHPN